MEPNPSPGGITDSIIHAIYGLVFALWGLVLLLGGLVFRGVHLRIKSLEDVQERYVKRDEIKRLEQLEINAGSFITRGELMQFVQGTQRERREMHEDNKTLMKELNEQNRTALGELRDSVSEVHKRIDDIWKGRR